jgi:hypothetical protein
MGLSKEDLAGIAGLLFLFAIGAWSAVNPAGAVRYFLKDRIERSPNQAGVRSFVRFIGICLIVLSAVCITATLKKR